MFRQAGRQVGVRDVHSKSFWYSVIFKVKKKRIIFG